MNDKPSEISSLTADELAIEIAHTTAMLMAAPSLPVFGFAPDPEALSAITARHAALMTERARRTAPTDDPATTGKLSRTVYPKASQLTLTTRTCHTPGATQTETAKVSFTGLGNGTTIKNRNVCLNISTGERVEVAP